MRKLKLIFNFILIALFLFIFLSCGITTSTNNHETSINEILPRKSFLFINKKVSIQLCQDDLCLQKTRKFLGSGAVVRNNTNGSFVLTAGHVCHTKYAETKNPNLKVETSFKITDIDGNQYPAKVIKYINDEKLDICMLYAPEADLEPVSVSKRAPKEGDKVYNLATPLGIFTNNTIPILEGRFIGYKDTNALYSVPAAPGSSGSPIFNYKGELIGVIHSVYVYFPNISIAVTYKDVKKFINQIMDDYYLIGNPGCHNLNLP